MEHHEGLSKKEIKEMKRMDKATAKASAAQMRLARRLASRGILLLFIVVFVGGIIYLIVTKPPVPEGDIVARNGIHWHPQLTIYKNGVKQEIPANIGLGAVHLPVHTHDEDSGAGVIHFEFNGVVQKKDITLKQFFTNWRKDFYSFGENVTMTVNGVPNTEYENYVIGEHDKIELRYE